MKEVDKIKLGNYVLPIYGLTEADYDKAIPHIATTSYGLEHEFFGTKELLITALINGEKVITLNGSPLRKKRVNLDYRHIAERIGSQHLIVKFPERAKCRYRGKEYNIGGFFSVASNTFRMETGL